MKTPSFKIPLLAMGLITSAAGSVHAQSETRASASDAESRALQHVMQTNEIAASLAPIKSAEDLKGYMAKTSAAESPLNYLSPPARNRFLSSLRFNEKGITSFSYVDLEAELTPSQIYKLLSLFGIQRTAPLMKSARVVNDADRMIIGLPDVRRCDASHESSQSPSGCDHEGYRCEGRGTCMQTMSAICTSNC